MGDKQGQATALINLSRAALYQGAAPQAAAHGLESLVLLRELGDREGLAECLEVLAGAAGALDQPLRAAQLFGAAEALRESIGAPLVPADHVGDVQTMLAARCRQRPRRLARGLARRSRPRRGPGRGRGAALE